MEKILIIDDEGELRATLHEVLTRGGWSVQEAASADQALPLLERAPFNLILLDMVMPGTDGMSAIPLIKKQAPRARIIMMTAFASVQNAVQAMQQGADDYIVKPFRIETLLLSVRRNLQQASFAGDCKEMELDSLFHGLANAMRRQILLTLDRNGPRRFMDLVRLLEVEDHTKVNFHLKVLREAGFIQQSGDKGYAITEAGHRAAGCLTYIDKSLNG